MGEDCIVCHDLFLGAVSMCITLFSSGRRCLTDTPELLRP